MWWHGKCGGEKGEGNEEREMREGGRERKREGEKEKERERERERERKRVKEAGEA